MRTVLFRSGLLVLLALGATFPASSQTEAASAPQTGPAQQSVAAPQLPPPPARATYRIDPVHSELSFRIRHLLGRVAGTFRTWSGEIVVDSVNPAASRVEIEVDVASIDTGKAERDAHLRTPDFFAVEQFPKMTFVSTQVTVQDRSIRILGELTIRGRTRPVVLAGTYQGRFPDPWGKTRVAYLASATVDRHDFGVSYDGPFLDIGQIGDEVWIEIAIEAVQQP